MSGGHWNYSNSSLANDIFGWSMDCTYGKEGFSQAKQARDMNPLEDREVSELTWDLMCLLYSYDYYISGDTGEEQYKEDLKYFKDKWFKRTPKNRLEAYKNDLKEYCDKLMEEME